MPHFTAANAAAMQARSRAAIAAKAEQRRLATLQAQTAAALAAQAAAPAPHQGVTPAVLRLDAQIERLNNLLDEATDAADIHRLTCSLDKLQERRRIILGIPLPGSQRPSRKGNRSQDAAEVIGIELPGS